MRSLGWFPLVGRLGPREVLRYAAAPDRTTSRDERPWRRQTVVNAVILREDVWLVVNLAAATEVEAIDAGAKMRAISLRAGEREHAHTFLTAPAWHAGQVSDVSSCACKNEGTAVITFIYDKPISDQFLVF